MDSYVIRIYRRVGQKSRILIGTAELVGAGKRIAFSNAEELWEILRYRRHKEEVEDRKPSAS